ncbi:hypothetical protein ACTGJ9_039275 [Bradyrhizobium sp. RDM12]
MLLRPMRIFEHQSAPQEVLKPAEHGEAKDDVQDGQHPGVVIPNQKAMMVGRRYAAASGIIPRIPTDMLIKAESATMPAMSPIPKCRCSVMFKVSDCLLGDTFFAPDSTFNAASKRSLAASISRRA